MNRSVTQEFKSSNGGAAAKDDAFLTQRQRLRKIGPFAVDSQSIPDSRTQFAGSWPPQTATASASDTKDDSEADDEDDQFNGTSSDHKHVRLIVFVLRSKSF